MVRLHVTDSPDMTIDVYRRGKTTHNPGKNGHLSYYIVQQMGVHPENMRCSSVIQLAFVCQKQFQQSLRDYFGR